MIYNSEQIKKLKELNNNNYYSAYKIKDKEFIVLDNLNGFGSTKETKQIKNKGFVALMPVNAFQSLSNKFYNKDECEELLTDATNGLSLANPVLFLDIENYITNSGFSKVVDFTNWNVANTLNSLNFKFIPVQFYILGYSPVIIKGDNEFLKSLNKGISSQFNRKSIGNSVQRYFLR